MFLTENFQNKFKERLIVMKKNEVNNKEQNPHELSRRRTKKKKRGFFSKLFTAFKVLTLLFVVASSLALLSLTLLVNHELKDMPVVDAQFLKTYPVSEIVDKDGVAIWKPTDVRVETVSYEEIPEVYKDILISVEDEEFWESKGISPKGIFNMVTSTIISKIDSSYKARGGSTIDQQLIKNKYFNGGQGINVITRKIQEIFLSLQLNENFTKEEVLTFYVNDLEFAERATGIKTIMKTYFNKTPEDYKERTPENIAEQAYLAGLSQAPTSYNLYVAPEEGRKRMLTVLAIAKESGVITGEEYELAKAHNLEDNLQERNWETELQRDKNLKYKTYTDGVKRELMGLGYDIDKLSIKIDSHLDTEVYEQIEAKARESKYYLDSNQQIAVTVLDSDNIVVGMVGSRNPDDELNRAVQTSRSTGSSTKPLLAYAPLLQYFGSTYSTATKFDTSNYQYPGSKSVMRNYGQFVYGYQTMHESLIRSHNTPVGRIMDGILGSDRVKNFLSGVDLDNKETYTSVDGLGINASSLQVASAYNAFNNLGEFTSPRFINKITFVNGEEITIEPESKKAMNPSVAWTINHMLRSVPQQGGTAFEAVIPGFEGYAGKTGTVGFASSVNAPTPYGIGSSDLWYNSFTNEGYSVSIWTGYDKPNTSPQMPSSHIGHKLLGRDLQKMLNEKAPAVWSQPEGVSKVYGSGRSAYYKVTDASANLFKQPNWVDLESYNKLKLESVVGNEDVDKDWKVKEDSKWFDYYNNNGDLNPTVINEELYRMIKGDD